MPKVMMSTDQTSVYGASAMTDANEEMGVYEDDGGLPPDTGEVDHGQYVYHGMDKNTDIWLRIAVIDNPTFNRPSANFNKTEVDGAVNVYNGKVCLRWVNMTGGVYNRNQGSVAPERDPAYNPEERGFVPNKSTSEIVDLTYPFIWVDGVNWCGFNYLPPVGTKVIVGFERNGGAKILGCLNPEYKHCQPPLLPGEVMIKGYGNNYVHWRQSNKLDLHVSVEENAQDLDDATCKKASASASDVWIRMDADNGTLKLAVNNTSITIDQYSIVLNANLGATLTIREDGVSTMGGTTAINTQDMDINAEVHHN